jgi:hypothetical protein
MSPDLRSTLHDAAATYSAGAPDMHAVRARGHQLTRRRRVAVSAVTMPVIAFAAAALLSSAGPLNGQPSPDEAPMAAGPAQSTPTTEPTPTGASPTGASPTEVSDTPTTDPSFKDVEDGRHVAYVRSLDGQAILYDQAQWREGCDATGDPSAGSYSIEKACIVNKNRALRLAPVADDVIVMSAPDGDPPERESLAWLEHFLVGTPDAKHWSYWLTIEDGVITKIEQVNPSGA